MSGKSRFKRRRVFLACATMLAIGSLLTIFWRQDEQRRMLIREIEESGGGYLTARRGPSWLPNQIAMRLGTDDDLEYLFLASTEIDDAWLAQLEGRDSIKQILLQDTDVTDAGLRHLSGLMKLERLRLDNTAVTDDGLEHLQNLKRLRRLYLKGTDVTDAGVERLQSALPNCQVIRR